MTANSTSFKPGNPGGPGRPKGSRDKLSFAFIKALSDDFEANGVEVVAKIREDKPEVYMNVIGKLMPKLMELSGPDGAELFPKSIECTVVTPEKRSDPTET
jgi:hypothetical protein